jgi:hypothetical protein
MGTLRMNKFTFLLTFCIAVACVATDLSARETVREFKGSRSSQTGEFEVEAPWILDWRVSGDFAQMMAVEVSLVAAGTGVHLGYVLKTKHTGNGVRLFNEGGRYFFKIDATMANWTLRVEQLSPEEAELYTPKSNDL